MSTTSECAITVNNSLDTVIKLLHNDNCKNELRHEQRRNENDDPTNQPRNQGSPHQVRKRRYIDRNPPEIQTAPEEAEEFERMVRRDGIDLYPDEPGTAKPRKGSVDTRTEYRDIPERYQPLPVTKQEKPDVSFLSQQINSETDERDGAKGNEQ